MVPAARARHEIGRDVDAALGADGPRLANLGDHAQQFFRRRLSRLHFEEAVFAERDQRAQITQGGDLARQRRNVLRHDAAGPERADVPLRRGRRSVEHDRLETLGIEALRR